MTDDIFEPHEHPEPSREDMEFVLNRFEDIPTPPFTPGEAKALLVGQLTAVPKHCELEVSEVTYLALKNLLNLLSIEKACSQITSMDTARIIEDAALGSRITLLEEILLNLTVK